MAFRLPRLQETAEIVGVNRRPTSAFQRWWQSVVKKIETQEATQDQMLLDIETALEQAGIAINRANAQMPDIPSVVINADYTGTIITGQLPRAVQAQRLDDTDDVTLDSDWSATLLSGSSTFSIGAATGLLEITVLGSSSTIQVTSEYQGIERSRTVLVEKKIGDPPPSSGAGSSSAFDSSITATSAATYGSANAGPVTLECGASGDVDLTAPLEVFLGVVSGSAHHCWGKWQVSAAGAGVWSDVAAEIQSSTPATNAGFGGSEAGYIEVSQQATGLTPGNDYDFQLLLRNDSGTDALYFVGTATAVTS